MPDPAEITDGVITDGVITGGALSPQMGLRVRVVVMHRAPARSPTGSRRRWPVPRAYAVAVLIGG